MSADDFVGGHYQCVHPASSNGMLCPLDFKHGNLRTICFKSPLRAYVYARYHKGLKSEEFAVANIMNGGGNQLVPADRIASLFMRIIISNWS